MAYCLISKIQALKSKEIEKRNKEGGDKEWIIGICHALINRLCLIGALVRVHAIINRPVSVTGGYWLLPSNTAWISCAPLDIPRVPQTAVLMVHVL
jgi:hypothetical protein